MAEKEDPSALSTAALKRALRGHVDPARLAQCIERPDYEQLYRETLGAGAALPPQQAASAAEEQPKAKVPVYQFRDEPATNKGGGGGGGFSLESILPPWQTMAMIAFAWYFIFGNGGGAGGIGGGGFGDSMEPLSHTADTAYISGHVAEVEDLPSLKQVMALHRDGTGLPVVIDFYSPYCGPCRQIAPQFKAMAEEYKGRAAFVKVDVNSARDVSYEFKIRAMPTFNFYLNGALAHSFRGGDSHSLTSYTSQLAQKAANAGTYVNREVTSADLRAFYEAHEPTKMEEVDGLLAKYGTNKTAKLIRTLRTKYKAVPSTTEVEDGAAFWRRAEKAQSVEAAAAAAAPPPSMAAEGQPAARGVGSGGGGANARLGSATVAQLRAELQRRQEEELAAEADARAASPPAAPPHTSSAAPASVVILGAGPAGLAAAIYAARAGLHPIVVAPGGGGQLEGKGVDVENFPGVVGASGPSLVGLMRAQASGFNATVVSDIAVGVDASVRPFRVALNRTSEPLHAKSLIVALGAESKWLGVKGEYEFRGGGVSSCATCDGFLFRDRPVLVVGGGDSAMEEALVLARTSSRVTLVHRGAKLRASHALASRVLAHPKIKVRYHTKVVKFAGEPGDPKNDVPPQLNQVYLADVRTHDKGGREERVPMAAAFIAIGHQPNTGLLKGGVRLRADGYIDMEGSGRSTRTSCAGIFAAGDVADPHYRQAVTSAGSGAAAALDAERWLSEGSDAAEPPCAAI